MSKWQIGQKWNWIRTLVMVIGTLRGAAFLGRGAYTAGLSGPGSQGSRAEDDESRAGGGDHDNGGEQQVDGRGGRRGDDRHRGVSTGGRGPGHRDITGNERTDEEAKRAANVSKTNVWVSRTLGDPLPVAKPALKARNKVRLKDMVADEYVGGRKMIAACLTPGTAKFVDNTDELPRRHTSMLGTGHIALRGYLHKIMSV
ncbi:hypothetical protein FA15DRAFT_698693 [Coprinopsis marcescibilis]|uniref:Uncharacterized protein n=1 Tax=Coprinopsis marcescibilis TaxID=230819 RepID=A0A5C3K9E0_COPMA|nr:hypothetical protein FA15DRAFT_698693 [Coprinopsis marcescibilis]